MRFVLSVATLAAAGLAHPFENPADAADAPLNRRAMNDIIANTTEVAAGTSLLERAAAWLPSLRSGDSVIEQRDLEERQDSGASRRTKRPWPTTTPVVTNRRTKSAPGSSVDPTPYDSAATTYILPQTTSSSTPSATPSPTQVPSRFSKVQDWTGTNFFNGWDWFTYADPTHGQVGAPFYLKGHRP